MRHRSPGSRRRRIMAAVLFVLVAGAAVPADAAPAQTEPPMTCEEMEEAGFPPEDVAACREQERRQCEEDNRVLPPEDQADCDGPNPPPGSGPCRRFIDVEDVWDLCEAFADFYDRPLEPLQHCVDLDTLEIAGRCQVPDWQFTPVVNAFHFDHDFACDDEPLGQIGDDGEIFTRPSRADAWTSLAELNDGFPSAYERICVRGPFGGRWTPDHVAAIGVIMAVETHRSAPHDGKQESLCHSWDPNNTANLRFSQTSGGNIRVPLNTICDTLHELGWPAYPARDEIQVHPGCPAFADAPDPRGSDGRGNDPEAPVRTDLIPDDCWGSYPATNYDIGYRAISVGDLGSTALDGDAPNVAASIWGTSTSFVFNLSKSAVTLALWLVDWAFIGFDIREYDDAIGANGAERFARRLIFHPQLPFVQLAWLVLAFWAGYKVLRGQMAVAGTEILLTIVLVGLSTVLMARQEAYMEATWGLMDNASTALLAAGQDQDPQDYEAPDGADSATARELRRQLVRGLNRSIFRAFVEQPYDLLNWGEPLGEPDDPDNEMSRCASRRNWILARGPWGTEETARDSMGEAGDTCQRLVDFNAEPSGHRLLGALLVLAASLVLSVLLGLIALTVVVAKMLAVLVFALAPFAALAAILPGNGRRLAWSWVTALIQVVIAVVGISFLLSFLLLVTDGLLGSTEGAYLVERFVILNVVVFVIIFARRRLLASSQSFAARLGDYWAATRGSGATWTGAGPGAGIDLAQTDRVTALAAVGAAAPAVLVGLSVANRWRERRMAHRQYRNLTRVTRWKYRWYRAI